MIDPADVRPVPVLLETTHHLLSLLPSELELPLDLYHFLDDRFRAIRTDLVLQEDAPPAILQPIARFYLLAQCILRHSTSKNLDGRSVSFASLKHLLEEQMHSILAQLKVSSLEFEQYYLLVLMDSASFSLTLRDVYIRSANAQALWSWFRSNTRRGNSEHILHRAILFGRLADQYHQHLIVLSKAFTKQDKFPLSDLVRIVGLTCIDDVALLCHAFHIDVHEIESPEPFDDEMGNAVNLQTKQVRKICHDLEADHLVSRYIDYKYFVDVVRYRLYLIRTYLTEAESLEIERQTYRCDNDDCGREYTALEAQKLVTAEIHEFYCGHCNSKLIECDNNERLQSAQSLLKKRNEVKLEPTAAVKEMPVHLQGSKMSNEMASKYKQNNMPPPPTPYGQAAHIKDEPTDRFHDRDDDGDEQDAMKAEIVLDDHTGHNGVWNDGGLDDDDGLDMVGDWEDCTTSQEEFVDPHYVNEFVTVQGLKQDLLDVTEADIDRMTKDEYVVRLAPV
ncbi:hypothetical protein DYB32_001438 [Aphanomyces invadans]|uniref:Transcription initiation factor IIE subunit alpha N-terminal domain-containing protein n=1 Tax=Aphanomyces invadans TaxID=157072 RepID=A0A418B6L1_9STRA|nr:hypothetical protein DYB32_001438 [Aphanomyces invadans]